MAVHRDHGGDDGGPMWPHLSSDGGVSCLGGWSRSRSSYMLDESNGGAVVVACSAGEGTMATLLLLCSTLERHAGERERENESESEREGECRAMCAPFWSGRAGRCQHTAATRHARPAPIGHDGTRQRSFSGLVNPTKTQTLSPQIFQSVQ